MNESVDRRILAAFRCVDAITGNAVVDPLPVSGPQWRLKPNRSGIYVIFDGPGLSSFTNQFVPSTPWPPPVTFEVAIRDPQRHYLPRRANLKAPQSVPNITTATTAPLSDPTTIFCPEPVALFPYPSAPVAPNWAVIRASVVRQGTAPPEGLPWAVLQVIRSNDKKVLATGMAGRNGEALLGVVGLTAQTNVSGNGPVKESTVAVTVQAWFDPSVDKEPSDWIPNPDDILSDLGNSKLKTSFQTAQLAAGQTLSMSFAISV